MRGRHARDGARRITRGSITAGCVSVLLSVGCGEAGDRPAVMRVERDTIADTLVVRTLAGSAWGGDAMLVPEVSIGEVEGDLEYLMGEVSSIAVGRDGTIYVLDRQGPELRAYAPDGRFLHTVGRSGEGPGELKAPEALAILSDGRLVVRDPGNGRIQVYDEEGEAVAAWPAVRGSFRTGGPFTTDREDNMYVLVLRDPEADVRDWRMALARIGPDGVARDTLDAPRAGFEAPTLEARSKGSASINGVPFSPSEAWMLHPDGYFVHGTSTDYRFTLLRPGSPLRIEKAWEPVPVTAGEKAEEEASVTRNMRGTDPGWRWNGPSIPDAKPPFGNLFAGRDGRIWVQVPAPSVEVEDTDYDPQDPNAVPDEWRDRFAFDVFEDDGTYLGRVVPPDDLTTYPQPVFDSDLVWGVTRDELGVQRVVRFRVTLPGAQE